MTALRRARDRISSCISLLLAVGLVAGCSAASSGGQTSSKSASAAPAGLRTVTVVIMMAGCAAQHASYNATLAR